MQFALGGNASWLALANPNTGLTTLFGCMGGYTGYKNRYTKAAVSKAAAAHAVARGRHLPGRVSGLIPWTRSSAWKFVRCIPALAAAWVTF